MSEIKVDTIGPRVDNGTLTIGASGDTVSIPSGATLANAGTVTGLPASAISSGTIATARLGSGTASSSTFLRGDQTYAATETNTPNFLARKTGSAQNLSHNTYTLITFNTEDIDTASDYDTGTSRYTFSVAGTYWVYVSIKADSTATNDCLGVVTELRKNGAQSTSLPQISDLKAGYISGTERPTQDAQTSSGGLRTFAVNDYIEVYCAVKTGTGGTAGRIQAGDGYNTFFSAYRVS